jgi:hypothetical protein
MLRGYVSAYGSSTGHNMSSPLHDDSLFYSDVNIGFLGMSVRQCLQEAASRLLITGTLFFVGNFFLEDEYFLTVKLALTFQYDFNLEVDTST